jgi:hypothetical protein
VVVAGTFFQWVGGNSFSGWWSLELFSRALKETVAAPLPTVTAPQSSDFFHRQCL